MQYEIEKPGPDMNVGIFICQRYFLSDNKYDAGMNCGKILRKVFWTRQDKPNIMDIYNIWLKRHKNELNSYEFKCFNKAFMKAMDKFGQQ